MVSHDDAERWRTHYGLQLMDRQYLNNLCSIPRQMMKKWRKENKDRAVGTVIQDSANQLRNAPFFSAHSVYRGTSSYYRTVEPGR
jgi:hypothetical protein